MPTRIKSTHVKASESHGKTAGPKKDGYAGRSPDPSAIGQKVGLTNHQPYSGPPSVSWPRTSS